MKEKNKLFKKSKGFTLIEMLVVVLIIGILAAVALPQYQKTVEKAKAAEVLTNLAAIKREIQVYLTAHDLPTDNRQIQYKDFATVELSGGEWNDTEYDTKDWWYYIYIDKSSGGHIEISRNVSDFSYTLFCTSLGHPYYNDDSPMPDGWYCSCVTQDTDYGRKMCKAIYEPLGFKYVDGEL